MEKIFRRAINITWGIVAACLISFLAMWLLSLNGIDWRERFFFLFFSIPLLMFALILLPMFYITRRRYATGTAALEQGKYLVHWHLEREEWERFHAIEWKKNRTQSITVPVGLAVLFFVVGLVEGMTTEIMAKVLPWAILATAAISILALIVNYRSYQNSVRRPREVIVGAHGLSIGGMYATWELIGTRLSEAKFVPGDVPLLEFTLKTWSKTGSRESKLRVPVPWGHEAEAQRAIGSMTKDL